MRSLLSLILLALVLFSVPVLGVTESPETSSVTSERPTFRVPGIVVSSTPIRLVYGVRLSILTVRTDNGQINVSCYYTLAWRCRRQTAGTAVVLEGEVLGSAAGAELAAHSLTFPE